jgi:hypothetical protein
VAVMRMVIVMSVVIMRRMRGGEDEVEGVEDVVNEEEERTDMLFVVGS